jgi:hypothetical protein
MKGNRGTTVNRLLVMMTVVLSLVILGGGAARSHAQEATPTLASAEALGYEDLSITVTDAGAEFPESIGAGRYLVTVVNATDHEVDMSLMKLPDGVTLEEVDRFIAESPNQFPEWWLNAVFAGGPVVVGGETEQTITDLTPGDWIVIGKGHPTLPLTVTGDDVAPIAAPEPAVAAEITLQEYAFVGLENIKASEQIWKVTNIGAQPHFLEMIKVPDGTTEAQLMALLMADPSATPAPDSLDPHLITDVGGLDTLSRNQTGWLVTDLEPGTYAAVCFIPDYASFEAHAMMGMIQVFDVN